jgi:hypothetical protein
LRKFFYICREMIYLVRTERMWLLAIALLFLSILALVVYQVTPLAVVTFIYAGI